MADDLLQPQGFVGVTPFSNRLIENSGQYSPLSDLYASADIYLRQQFWCKSASCVSLGGYEPGIVGVFLYLIELREGESVYNWLVTGPVWKASEVETASDIDKLIVAESYMGLPTAHIWTGYPTFSDKAASNSPWLALESYCGVIEDWIKAVNKSVYRKKPFPVRTPECQTRKHYAEAIEPILDHLDSNVIPNWRTTWELE